MAARHSVMTERSKRSEALKQNFFPLSNSSCDEIFPCFQYILLDTCTYTRSHFVLPSITAPPYIISCVHTYIFTLIPYTQKTLDDMSLYAWFFWLGIQKKILSKLDFTNEQQLNMQEEECIYLSFYLGTQGKIATQLASAMRMWEQKHTHVCWFVTL